LSPEIFSECIAVLEETGDIANVLTEELQRSVLQMSAFWIRFLATKLFFTDS
jgi:hypothetical protein